MARKLVVEIVGDASQLSRTLRQVQGQTQGFSGHLARLSKMALVASGAAGLGAVVGTLKAGISEWSEHARVAAQTEAVLKSTGAAANVTAGQIERLAGQIMAKSGIDDEAIQSGENLLLTFTQIRNEAGRGNDIFAQATKVMADMSVALGQDVKSSALQLGKALNDPIHGLTALRRVGVSFTEDQQRQIKALAESGHAMEAQKLILAELHKEFGGSAEAAGKTLPGQLQILKQQFNNLAGEIVSGAMPAIQGLVSWTSAHGPEIGTVLRTAFGTVGQAIQALVAVGETLLGFYEHHKTLVLASTAALGAMAGAIGTIIAVQRTVKAATEAWTAAQAILNAVLAANPIGIVVVALAGLAAAIAVAWARSETFRAVVTGAWEAIRTATVAVFHAVESAVTGAWDAIRTATTAVLDFLRSHWRLAVVALATILAGPLGALVSLIATHWGQIEDAVVGVVNRVRTAVTGVFGGLGDAIKGALGAVRSAVGSIVHAIEPIIDALRDLASAADHAIGLLDSIADKARAVPGAIGGAISKAKDLLHIPHFASGVTNFGGGLALVGEQGPELVALPAGSSVIPTPQTRRLLAQTRLLAGAGAAAPISGGVQRPVEVHVHLPGAVLVGTPSPTVGRELARVIAPHLDRLASIPVG